MQMACSLIKNGSQIDIGCSSGLLMNFKACCNMPVFFVLQSQHPQIHDVRLLQQGTFVTDQGAAVVQPCLNTARLWAAHLCLQSDRF